MKITREFLVKNNACEGDVATCDGLRKIELKTLIQFYIHNNKFDLGNLLLTKILKEKELVEYAMYAAKLVLPIFEKCTDSDKPHLAIEAAKSVIAAANTAYIAYIADATKVVFTTNAANAVNAAYIEANDAYAAYIEANNNNTVTDANAVATAAANAANVAYTAYYTATKSGFAINASNVAKATGKKILDFGLNLIERRYS